MTLLLAHLISLPTGFTTSGSFDEDALLDLVER